MELITSKNRSATYLDVQCAQLLLTAILYELVYLQGLVGKRGATGQIGGEGPKVQNVFVVLTFP